MRNVSAVVVSTVFLAVAAFAGAAEGQTPKSGANGWPREIDTDKGNILLYQPQVDSLNGDKLSSRAAVSITLKGKSDPIYGAVWLESRLSIDREARSAEVVDVKVPKMRFHDATPEQETELRAHLEKEIPSWHLTIPLDGLKATLVIAAKKRETAGALSLDPPIIVFSDVPAMLVQFDGEPKFQAFPGAINNVTKAVNTPCALFHDPESKLYYLATESGVVSSDNLKGGWAAAPNPPAQIAAAFSDEKGNMYKAPAGSALLKIVTASKPAELIASTGKLNFVPVVGDEGLLFADNTQSDVFMEASTRRVYILLSGRWFSAESTNGPWSFAPADKLPPVFAKIPITSPKAAVLAEVAGTPEAAEALADAELPQTGVINRSGATVKVTYDGAPKFEPVENTNLKWAVNSPYSVILVNGKYYCCHEGVWYVSAAPDGPWALADKVPGDIQSIPPSNPLYNTKYAEIYDSTPDSVCVGYTPGYLGSYGYGGAVLYGTGYWYHGWMGSGGYYPRASTWGYGFAYNPVTGWHGGTEWGPGGWAAWGRSGGAHWGNWWGPGGYPYHPNRLYSNNQNSWKSTGNQWSHTQQPRPQNLYARHQSSQPYAARQAAASTRRATAPSTGRANDLFVDHDGNVMRRGSEGWQTRQQGDWTKPQPAAPQTHWADQRSAQAAFPTIQDATASRNQMEREYQARQWGAQRSSSYGDFSNYTSGYHSGGHSSGGHSGGGHGGGGRR